jgi:ABC-type uncharacterized transport system substrate-binding protein
MGPTRWPTSREVRIRFPLAECVDKILRGAKPVYVPVRRPTKLELVINFETAKALDLIIPPSPLGGG